MNKKISYKPLKMAFLVLLLGLLVLAYDFFLDYISFLDELIAVVFVVLFFFVSKIKLIKKEFLIIGLLFGVLILGLLSNLLTPKKIVPEAIGLDMLSFYKAFIVYFGIRTFFKDVTYIDFYPYLKALAYWALGIILFFLFIDVFFHVFPEQSRFGLRSIELFFKHPSRLSFAVAFIFIVLYPKYAGKGKLFLVAILFLGVFTLRVKYFGFILIALFSLYNKQLLTRINKKYIYILLSLTPFILFFIFKDWIMFYFSDEAIKLGWSRAVLLKYSFIVAHDFFPFGTGFGSFASHFSGPNYSWVYGYYGIDGVWGMQRKYYQFLGDQYWPMILGQFGVFGLIFMIGVIGSFLTMLLTFFKSEKNTFVKDALLSGILGLLMLLLDSTADAIFSQNRGVVIFILLGLMMNTLTYKRRTE